MEENERVIDPEEQKQQVWSWGAGTEGQLGTNNLQDEHLPQLLPFLPPLSFLSCGGAHVIALTPDKKVLTWGRGNSGQLGHGNLLNNSQPKFIDILNNFNITNVSAGWNHSGFVSESGHLFTCGDGQFGQLGHGDYTSQTFPVKVSFFSSKNVDQIACGMRHSLVLLKGENEDKLYSFGSGKRGQLGISKKVKSINIPESVIGLKEVNIVGINSNGDHSAALSENGDMYTWGRGFGSKKEDVCCPNLVISPFKFTQIALGWNHALLLTDEGEVVMLGGSHHGVLNNLQKDNLVKQDSIEKIHGLDGIKVVGIASGSEHSVLTTENGVVMTWGWGEHGQLGLGKTCDEISPQVVKFGQHQDIMTSKVYCGSGFTFVVRNLR